MADGRRRSDDGFTLIELVVSISLLMLVLSMFAASLFVMVDRVQQAGLRSESNDQIRLAIQEMDRQVRSGNVIHDPTKEAEPGMMLRIYTQTAHDPAAPNQCVQWRVSGTKLQVRSWIELEVGELPPKAWRTVAEHVRNDARGIDAFRFDDAQLAFGNRIIRVVLVTNRDTRAGGDVRVEASLTGRNVQFGYPLTHCATTPPEA